MVKSLVRIFIGLLLIASWPNLWAQHVGELRQIIDTLASRSMEGRKAGNLGAVRASRYIAGYYIQHNIPSVKGTYDTLDYLQPFSIERFYDLSKVYAIHNNDTIALSHAEAFLSPGQKNELLAKATTILPIQRFENLMHALDTLSKTGSPVIFLLPYRLYFKVTKRFFEANFLLSPAPDFLVVDNRQKPLTPLIRMAKNSIGSSGRIVLFISENQILDNKLTVGGSKSLAINPEVKFLITRSVYNESIVTENVVAAIPTNNPEKQWLIVGAHYDHLGKTSKGDVYGGADDNASGTAAIMVVAKEHISSRKGVSHNLLFVAFSAEEMGLYGSRYFVNSSLMPENTMGMINLDMVGRPENIKYTRNYVYAKYPPKGKKVFKQPVKTATVDSLLVITKPPLFENLLYRFGSDHANFHAKGIPFLVLFTGLHPDYHKTTDTPDKIAYENLNRIVLWILMLIRTV